MSAARSFVGQVFSWFLLAAVIAGALALIVVPKATDARPLTVLSGSMSGTLEVGDVVIVKPVATDELGIGDVITFQAQSNDPTLTTHRIVGIAYGSEGAQFVTQGDANNAADLSPIAPEQIMGEVWYSVPLVGYASVWLAGSFARLTIDLLAIALLLYGGWFIAAALIDRRRKAVPA